MWNRLFGKILDSSIWLEPTSTRIVWITLLAAMDQDGYAHFSATENLANRARVSVEEAQKAIDCFVSPDENSENPENEGRRLEKVPGGFLILNAAYHRQKMSKEIERENTRLRVARYRAKQKEAGTERSEDNGVSNKKRNKPVTALLQSVSPVSVSSSVTSLRKKEGSGGKEGFDEFWTAYPRKVAKSAALKAWRKVDVELSVILLAVARQKKWPDWTKDNGKFIPHPATWLNGRRWEDEPPPATSARPPQKFIC